MKIKHNYQEIMTIQQFAEEHDLTMVINRSCEKGRLHYSAIFENAELMDGYFLIHHCGSGASAREAMSHYAELISDKVLAVQIPNTKTGRREIQVPTLFLPGRKSE